MNEKSKVLIIIFEILILIIASIITGNIIYDNYLEKEDLDIISTINVDIQSYCFDEKSSNKISFQATTNEPFKSLTYRWEFGDGSTSNDKNPIHKYLKPGVYQAKLTIFDDDGNKGSDVIIVNVKESDLVQAKIGVNVWSGFEPLIVYFYGDPENILSNVSYYWEFGPKNRIIVPMSDFQYYIGGFKRFFNNRQKCKYNSYEKDPIMVFCYEGLYWAKLKVTDENGISDTDKVWIQVYDIDIHTTVLNNIFNNNNN